MSQTPLVMVTCYDATFARICADTQALDYLLVGDSLGMVISGETSTLHVSLDHILYHLSAVRRGLSQSLAKKMPILMGDMPVHTYDSPEMAVSSARKMLNAGAEIVKVEGPCEDVVKALRSEKIRVCGHIGLTPQSIQDYKVQGRTEAEAGRLFKEALLLEKAGVELLVLEMIPMALSKKITATLQIPTIGIGAGPYCGGQVLVLYDLLGFNPDFNPKFLKKYLTGYDFAKGALEAYAREVKTMDYPLEKNSFK